MSDSVTPQTVARWAPLSWNSSEFHGRNTGVGSHSLLKGIFPTQGSNFGLLHCRQILHHLSQQMSVWRVAVRGQRPHRIPRKAPPHPQLGWHWFHQGGSQVSTRGPAGLSVLSSSSSRRLVFGPVLRSHCFQKQLPHGAQLRDEEARRAGSFLPTPRLLALNQAVKVSYSVLPTLCDPMDYTVLGILQARVLEWVAFPFSK